jgi:hypothetical protein
VYKLLDAILGVKTGSFVELLPISIVGKDCYDASGDVRLLRIRAYWNKVLALMVKDKNATAGKALTAGAAVHVPLLRLYGSAEDHAGPNRVISHAVAAAMTLHQSDSVVLLLDDIEENTRRAELIETLCSSFSLKETLRSDLPQWPMDPKTTFIMLSK